MHTFEAFRFVAALIAALGLALFTPAVAYAATAIEYGLIAAL
jgi:hypothetical protein